MGFSPSTARAKSMFLRASVLHAGVGLDTPSHAATNAAVGGMLLWGLDNGDVPVTANRTATVILSKLFSEDQTEESGCDSPRAFAMLPRHRSPTEGTSDRAAHQSGDQLLVRRSLLSHWSRTSRPLAM